MNRITNPFHLDNQLTCWDERWKILSFFIVILVISIVKNLLLLVFLDFLTLILLAYSGVGIKQTLKQILWPMFFIFLCLPLFALTTNGVIGIIFFGIPLYLNGIILGSRIILRSFSLLIIVGLLFQTTNNRRLFCAFNKLKFPGLLVNIFLFTLRYIQLYSRDYKQLVIASKLRGGNKGKKVLSLSVSFGILITLLIRSFEQSERTYYAMKLRAYDQSLHVLDSFQTKSSDVIKFSLVLLLSIGVLILNGVIFN